MTLRKTIAGAVIALGMTMGSSALAATVVNLGFAIDHSGSISETTANPHYTLQKQGLAQALELVAKATDDPNNDVEYRVAVITFGADVKTLVPPTTLTMTNLAGIQNSITSHVRTNTGATITGTAINTLTSMFRDDPTDPNSPISDLTLFNISTDGTPTGGADPEAAATAAFNAGVDGISFELVGSFNQTAINRMLGLAGPGAVHITNAADLPNPVEKGFVFEIAHFDDYEGAIGAKIQRIVDDTGGGPSPIPVPAALPLLLGGLGMMGALRLRRRAA